MSSPTKQTESIRSRKARKAGASSKAARRNKGTTLSKADLFGDKE